MKLAILFWFYKDLDVCASRLAALRTRNRGVPIYGLFGGDSGDVAEARRRLGHRMDDFYAFSGGGDARWRWQNGDRMLAVWHVERGCRLAWDTIVVVQWDMLVLGSVARIFSMLKPGEALFSGLRSVSEVAGWWPWANGPHRQDMDALAERLRREFGYGGDLWCCLFIVVCLPRRFLDLYAASGPPEEGFFEYKMPTMARVFEIPLCTAHRFHPWWAADPNTYDAPPQQRILNAVGAEIGIETVLEEAASRDRIGLIHPYRRPVPWWLMLPPIARMALRWPSLRRAAIGSRLEQAA